MGRSIWIKILSIILALVLAALLLPTGVAAPEDGGADLPNQPGAIIDESGGDRFATGDVLAPADSLPRAQTIADSYGLELLSYSYGIAVLSAPSYTMTVNQSSSAQSLPKLSPNRLYHTYEIPYTESNQDNSRRLSSTAAKRHQGIVGSWGDYGSQAYYEPLYAESTYIASAYAEPFDVDALPNPLQWHRVEIDADRAHAISTGKRVVIAVIDTGIDIDHPAFAGRISNKSYNVYSDRIGIEYVRDDYGHGTHVSGIAAAALDATSDVCGIAPDAELLVIKANEPKNGRFTSADLYRAINYATQNGADVINLSLGREYDGESNSDDLERQIIANAVAAGVSVVCAAGNNRNSHAGYPAAYPESIAVSATKQGYNFENAFSNYGPEIDVAAPGSDIYSTTWGGGYGFMKGTSMAAPNVAGVAALVLELHPSYTPQQVRDTLRETARDAGAVSRDDYYGYGIVNAYAATLGTDALYSVTYNFMDDVRDPVAVKVIPGDKLLPTDPPLRDGYLFEGWFIDGADEAYSYDRLVTGNLNLRAKWKKSEDGMYILEFPDLNFRFEILRLLNNRDGGYRKDSSFIENDLTTIALITKLDVVGMSIRNMSGLQYFSGLESLVCDYNYINELDVSKNTALKWLDCSYNELLALDVSKNTALVSLKCGGNKLSVLDVSKNTALTELHCQYAVLSTLNVSANAALECLECFGNQLTQLDVSGNAKLSDLECDINQLKALDVSKNLVLEILRCEKNQLDKLDVSNTTYLRTLSCGENPLTRLDVSKNRDLLILDCSFSQLGSLDVSGNPMLESLYCWDNQLARLDVSRNIKLTQLWCHNNQLAALDVSRNTALEVLVCHHNKLTSLDVSRNAALEWLDCQYNQMTSIDKVAGWLTNPKLAPDRTFYFYPQQEKQQDDENATKQDDNRKYGGNANSVVIEPVTLTEESPRYEISGVKTILTPDGHDPIANPDGSLTLPGGGTIITNGGSEIEVPGGTAISNDGIITIPNGKVGGKIKISADIVVDFGPGMSINVPVGDESLSAWDIKWINPFADVSANDWFFGDIQYTYTFGLINGVSANAFSPHATLTRGMLVTILYRDVGQPSISGFDNLFSDTGNAYFTEAVIWASKNGVVKGYENGTFCPNDEISRQDLAVILSRYLRLMEHNPLPIRQYSGFKDGSIISGYAKEDVIALYEAGVVNGNSEYLFNPFGRATRAEAAAILHRL
ncbi:MAG: S8 family serine peptidase [Oscillospiraceae bacterium]|nr:S8 family serine peptidase [Oscillospiraceae bacterium]